MVVCSDYKFMLALLGLKSATADNACIWCNATKGNSDWCDGTAERRTLQTIARDLPRGKNGTKLAPVFKIPVCNFFVGMGEMFHPNAPNIG